MVGNICWRTVFLQASCPAKKKNERNRYYATISVHGQGVKLKFRHLCIDIIYTAACSSKMEWLLVWCNQEFCSKHVLSLCVADVLCASNQCKNGGTCWQNFNGTRWCQCAYGYTGVHCETDLGKTAVTVLEQRWQMIATRRAFLLLKKYQHWPQVE